MVQEELVIHENLNDSSCTPAEISKLSITSPQNTQQKDNNMIVVQNSTPSKQYIYDEEMKSQTPKEEQKKELIEATPLNKQQE